MTEQDGGEGRASEKPFLINLEQAGFPFMEGPALSIRRTLCHGGSWFQCWKDSLNLSALLCSHWLLCPPVTISCLSFDVPLVIKALKTQSYVRPERSRATGQSTRSPLEMTDFVLKEKGTAGRRDQYSLQPTQKGPFSREKKRQAEKIYIIDSASRAGSGVQVSQLQMVMRPLRSCTAVACWHGTIPQWALWRSGLCFTLGTDTRNRTV